ncbi:MAG: hypothetical protein ACLUNO_13005, partial [Oscillospiraceae bacterium]
GGRAVAFGGAGKAGAVIGTEEVIVNGLGARPGSRAAVPIARLHVTADLVAGVHGVVAAVIEEIKRTLYF